MSDLSDDVMIKIEEDFESRGVMRFLPADHTHAKVDSARSLHLSDHSSSSFDISPTEWLRSQSVSPELSPSSSYELLSSSSSRNFYFENSARDLCTLEVETLDTDHDSLHDADLSDSYSNIWSHAGIFEDYYSPFSSDDFVSEYEDSDGPTGYSDNAGDEPETKVEERSMSPLELPRAIDQSSEDEEDQGEEDGPNSEDESSDHPSDLKESVRLSSPSEPSFSESESSDERDAPAWKKRIRSAHKQRSLPALLPKGVDKGDERSVRPRTRRSLAALNTDNGVSRLPRKLDFRVQLRSVRRYSNFGQMCWTADDDDYIVHLRENIGLSWRQIATRISNRHTPGAIQMRYLRHLRNRFADLTAHELIKFQAVLKSDWENRWSRIARLMGPSFSVDRCLKHALKTLGHDTPVEHNQSRAQAVKSFCEDEYSIPENPSRLCDEALNFLQQKSLPMSVLLELYTTPRDVTVESAEQ